MPTSLKDTSHLTQHQTSHRFNMPSSLTVKELTKAITAAASTSASITLLSESDENAALDVLADAFIQDPMMVWIAGLSDDDPNRQAKMYAVIHNLMGWVCHRLINGDRGIALGITDKGNNSLVGVMSLASSSHHKGGILDWIQSMFKFGAPPMYKRKEDYCPSSAKRLDALSIIVKKRSHLMKDTKRWIYVQSIGVHSLHHGKGYGKQMLQLLFNVAQELNAPVFLETESKDNEGMYQHFGFRTLEVVDLFVQGDEDIESNHQKMYMMRRD